MFKFPRINLKKAGRSVIVPANPASSVMAVGRYAGGMWRLLGGLAGMAITPPRPDARLLEIENASARFQEATGHLDPYGLRDLEASFARRQVISCLIAIVILGLALIAPSIGLGGATGVRVIDAGLVWMFFVWVFLRHALTSLRVIQIARREMVGWRALISDWPVLLCATPKVPMRRPMVVLVSCS